VTTQAPGPVTTQAPVTQPPGPRPDFTTPQDLMVCEAGAPARTTECMSTDDYNAIEDQIRDIMTLLGDECNNENCPQADWAGCVLRMAGHDFMDFDPAQGIGGSDGCTNLEDPDNKGLNPCLATGEFGHSLKDVYQNFCTRISLADFLVVSGEAVMTVLRNRVSEVQGAALQLNFHQNFLFGRTTQHENCEFQVGLLPNPEHGCPDVQRVFMQNLGLDEAGSAALMGVHSIGRARAENSGYEGFWSDPENSRLFNNNYFVSMLAKGWGPVEMSEFKHQWNRIDRGTVGTEGHREMMLNSDLCLLYNEDNAPLNAATNDCCAWVDTFVIGGSSDGQHTGAIANNDGMFCGVNCATDPELTVNGQRPGCDGGIDERNMCCGSPNGVQGDGSRANDCGAPFAPAGLASAAVQQFAADDDAWILAFEAAWKQVTEIGATNLQALTASCPA